MNRNTPAHLLLSLLLFPALTLVLVSGCGSEEEEPETTSQGAPTPAPLPDGEPGTPDTAPPGVAMGETVPETLAVLQYMPEGAQVAFAIPPVPGLIDDAAELGHAMAPPEADVDADIDEFFAGLGEKLGVEAGDYETLADALGLDMASPLALFADFSGVVATAAAREAEAESAVEDPAALTDDSGAPREAPELMEKLEGRAAEVMEDVEQPAWVAVAGVADAEKAIAALQRVAGENEALRSASAGTETVGGVEIVTRGGYGYFLAGRHLAFGDLHLLRGAAERVGQPAAIRYGTVEAPAAESDEIVTLVYGGRFLPIMEEALPLMGVSAQQTMLATAQLKMYEAMFSEDDDDPIIGTLACDRERLEMRWRVDTATHPGILEYAGPAHPLRLARYLPESTLAMLSFRFNDEYKAQIMNDVMPAVSASGDADMAMQTVFATQFLSQLGDEATIGVAEGAGPLPELYVLLGMADPASTRGVLEAFLPMASAGDHEGTPIQEVETPLGMPAYLSFLDDFALASTSEDGIRAVISRYKAGELSGLFASLDPPFDIEQPRYQATIIQTRIAEKLLGAAAVFSADTPDTAEFAPLLTALRELRTGKMIVDGWLTGHMTLYFGDLEQAAELRAAISAAPEGAEP